MRRALVIVDHGSLAPEAHAHLEALARSVAELAPEWRVRVAHMDLAEPSIQRAIDACVEEGAAEVRVFPLFVSPGRHLLEDVPALVEAAAARHVGVRVTLTEPLGASPLLAALIVEAVRRA